MLYLLPTLCIIAQLCALCLFIMHKGDFFHFLHKRENPSFLAFGKNAQLLGCALCICSQVLCFYKLIFTFSERFCRFLL